MIFIKRFVCRAFYTTNSEILARRMAAEFVSLDGHGSVDVIDCTKAGEEYAAEMFECLQCEEWAHRHYQSEEEIVHG